MQEKKVGENRIEIEKISCVYKKNVIDCHRLKTGGPLLGTWGGPRVHIPHERLYNRRKKLWI